MTVPDMRRLSECLSEGPKTAKTLLLDEGETKRLRELAAKPETAGEDLKRFLRSQDMLRAAYATLLEGDPDEAPPRGDLVAALYRLVAGRLLNVGQPVWPHPDLAQLRGALRGVVGDDLAPPEPSDLGMVDPAPDAALKLVAYLAVCPKPKEHSERLLWARLVAVDWLRRRGVRAALQAELDGAGVPGADAGDVFVSLLVETADAVGRALAAGAVNAELEDDVPCGPDALRAAIAPSKDAIAAGRWADTRRAACTALASSFAAAAREVAELAPGGREAAALALAALQLEPPPVPSERFFAAHDAVLAADRAEGRWLCAAGDWFSKARLLLCLNDRAELDWSLRRAGGCLERACLCYARCEHWETQAMRNWFNGELSGVNATIASWAAVHKIGVGTFGPRVHARFLPPAAAPGGRRC